MKIFNSLSVVTAASLSLFALTSSLRSQIVISEVEFTPRSSEGQWIEVTNLSTKTTVDLSKWSVYQATRTPSKPQTYWYGFPSGTTLAPGAFLRVHWLAKPKANTKTDIYTGNTLYHFLFGLFAEPLDASLGAVALLNTKDNLKMNTASVIQAWVSWGSTGFKRENLAITNKRWTKNSAAKAAIGTPAPSLAFDYGSPGSPHAGTNWFLDSSPTPGANNLGGASVTRFGTACKGALTQIARLESIGVPALGNRDFGARIDRNMLADEFVFNHIGVRGDGSVKFFGCPFWLDTTKPFLTLFVPAVNGVASVRVGNIPESVIKGQKVVLTWAILDVSPVTLAFTNGVEVQFGN